MPSYPFKIAADDRFVQKELTFYAQNDTLGLRRL